MISIFQQPHLVRRAAALLSVAWLAAACGGDATTLAPAPPPSITLSVLTAEALTARGDTRAITAVARDTGGALVPLPALVWASGAPNVATVSGADGGAVVTAVGDGTAEISATGGGARGRLVVRVHRTVASLTLSAPSPTLTLGASMQLVATALDPRQQPFEGVTGFTYTSSDPHSVLVSPGGVATALFDFDGSAMSLVTATLTRTGVSVSDTVRVRVVSPQPFDFLALLLSESVRPEPARTPGQGVAYLTNAGDRIGYLVTWSDLSGPATAVHLHAPSDTGGVAEVLADLRLPAQDAPHGSATDAIFAPDIRAQGGRPPIDVRALATLLADGLAYVDVHTAAHPEGEIRGTVILRRDPAGSLSASSSRRFVINNPRTFPTTRARP